MARAKTDNPQDYKGPRTPIRGKGTLCGWCNADDHDNCKHELPFYEKLWICSCKCNDNWVPQDLGGPVEEKNAKRGTSRKDNRTADDDSTRTELADEEDADDLSDYSDPQSESEPDESGESNGLADDGGEEDLRPDQGLGESDA